MDIEIGKFSSKYYLDQISNKRTSYNGLRATPHAKSSKSDDPALIPGLRLVLDL